MNSRVQKLVWAALALLLAGCAALSSPSPPPSSTPAELPASPTPSATPNPPTATPTEASPPSPTPSPSPTPTPAGLDWTRYPNALDFRAIIAQDDTLWLGSSSGLVQVDLLENEWLGWTEADGLADNTLVSLDCQGDWLWLGTQGGVSRFDPRSGEWHSYTTNNGLSSNHNVQILVDGDTVWAGTQNGLSWYIPETDSWESLFTINGIELTGVVDMIADERALWVSVGPGASLSAAILELDKETEEWKSLSVPVGESFTLAQNESALWAVPSVGTPWEYNKSSGNWRPVLEIASQGSVGQERFRGARYHAGALWLYAELAGELIRYEPASHRLSRYPAAPLAALGLQGKILGLANTLWFSGQQGLVSLDLETGEWQALRRGVSAIYAVQGERAGALLVRTDLGPGFWNPESGHWQPLAPVGGRTQSYPNEVAVDQSAQYVWLAELPQGAEAASQSPRLLYFSRPGVEPQPFVLTPPAGWELLQLLPNSIGNTLWFLGSRGFLSYNLAIDLWGVFEMDADVAARVRHVQQQANLVWFLTDTELGQFDTNTGSTQRYALPAVPAVQSALAVAPDTVWVLVDRMLYGWTPADSSWRSLDVAAPCLDEATLLASWQSSLWLGGRHGVGQIDPAGGGWTCYTPSNGMLDAEFAGLFPAQDALWFSHPTFGVWRFKTAVGP